jgi:hypothetical protein
MMAWILPKRRMMFTSTTLCYISENRTLYEFIVETLIVLQASKDRDPKYFHCNSLNTLLYINSFNIQFVHLTATSFVYFLPYTDPE